MQLTGHEFYALVKIYPLSDFERDGEPLYIAKQRQKKQMQMHIARQRFAGTKPMWNAVIQAKRAGFSLRETAWILQTDIDTIENEWDRIQQNAR